MTKREIATTYRHLSPADRAVFDRWLKANAIGGSIFAAAFLVMAVAGSDAGPRQAMANSEITDVGAAMRHSDAGRVSPTELTIRIAPSELPVQQVDQPF